MNGVMGLAGWQWMFILEAIPALTVGFLNAITLDDSFSSRRTHPLDPNPPKLTKLQKAFSLLGA